MIIAKYTYSNYAFVPTFNDGFNYEYTDIYDSSTGITTRTITSDTLPTFISFRSSYVTTVEYLNVSKVTSMENMFNGCYYLTSINTNDWDTSNVTNMEGMFYNCNALSSLDVSKFNTGKVTNMKGMFCNCTLTSLDVSNWNTGLVTDMGWMFSSCTNLASLDVSNWDTKNVTNMMEMFWYCYSLTSLNVSNWDTSSLISTNHMFYYCYGLTSLDVSDWDTGNVTDMGEMFYNCKNLTTLDVSNWNTDKVTNIGYMFNSCNLLTALDVSNWNTSRVTNMDHTFCYCQALTTLDLSNWNTNRVTNMDYMFCYCQKLTTLDLSNFDTSNVISMYMMFRGCEYLTSLNISNWDISKVSDMSYMFDSCPRLALINLSGCSKLTINKIISQLPDRSEDDLYYRGIEISKNAARNIDKEMLSTKCWSTNKRLLARYTFNTDIDTIPNLSGVTGNDGMYYSYQYFVEDTKNSNGTTTRELFTFIETPPTRIYFSGCKGLKTLEYLYINNIKDMDSTFSGCTNLTSVNISDWDTSKVTRMGWMFNGCSSLTSLDLSNWDTGNVTAMHSMFNGCSSLTSLDLSNWNVSQVETTNAMFEGCTSLTSLNLKYWDTGKVDDMRDMFNGCSKLTYLDLNSFNTNLLFDYGLEDIFTDCTSLSDLFLNNWNLSYSVLMTNVFKNCSNLRYVSMINSNKDTVNKIVGALPSRTATSTGQIIVGDQSGISASGANSANKYWATLVQENNKFTFSADTFKYFIRSFKNRFALKSEVNSKVDKVEGKGLSTKDFTDSYCESCKNVLSNVQIGKIYERRNYWTPYATNTILYFEQNNEDSYLELLIDDSKGTTLYSLDIDKNALKNLKFKNKNGEDWTPVLTSIEDNDDIIVVNYEEFYIYYSPFDQMLGCEYSASILPFYIYIPKYTGVVIPFDKYRPSGLIVGCDTNFVCESGNEYRIYYKYATAYPYLDEGFSYGKHTLVAEITTANGQIRKEEVVYDSYDDIPNYYSYIPNTNDVAIKMYFIDMLGIKTGATYLKPTFKNFVVVYEFNTGQDVLPTFNSGYTGYITNDKTKKNSVERTLTSNSVPSSVSFSGEFGLTKATYMSQTLTNTSGLFKDCRGLKETYIYGNNVTDISNMYHNCSSLIKMTECGTNVTNMSYTYANCYSLTGPAVCGPNVTNMYNTYKNCFNLTGSPVCGNNVIDMSGAYDSCWNLTGQPVCGNNVTDMIQTYYGCNNLTGSPICGNNVTNMLGTYYNCVNLTGNGYFYSNSITNVSGCFGKKDNSKRLNIYVPDTNVTVNTIVNSNSSTNSITGQDITLLYTKTEYEEYYVNAAQNVYVYPVSNVADTYDTHMRSIISYVGGNSSIRPKTVTILNGSSNYEAKTNGQLITLVKTDMNAIPLYVDFSGKNIIRVMSICDTITSMAETFYNCKNLTGSPVCGPNVTNMYWTYYYCYNLTGNPVCGDNVTDMTCTYFYCNNITGSPLCGPNVTDMTWTYQNCQKLIGSPVCGNKVITMSGTYENCVNLTGSPVCGDKVINMQDTYYNCYNLTGSPVCGNKVTDMYATYRNCQNLTGSPVCGPNVIDMSVAYDGCRNLTGSPVCGNKVTDMSATYANCVNLTGNPVCGNNVTTMFRTYNNCYNLTGSPVCGPNVTNMYRTYSGCNNITGTPVCGSNVTDMEGTYAWCSNLTGQPVCGPNVISMDSTYIYCPNLTGNPVCGPNVINMSRTYVNSQNLTGSPVCGPNVTNMYETYNNCTNLTGRPACGNNVTNMYCTYVNCQNLTGPVYIGSSVVNMYVAFMNCVNIQNCNVYVTSMNVANAARSFNVSTGLNIYVPANSLTLNTFINQSIRNSSVSWTLNNNIYTNTYYDLRVIPTNSVVQLYRENELGIVTYATTNLNERPVSMTGAIEGYGASIDGNNVKLYRNSENDIITHISFKGSTTLTSIVSMTDSITNMTNAFCDCSNLISRPMCGNNVITMDCAYKNCRSLTRGPILGSNVTNMKETFNGCTNINGNGYIYSNKVNFASNCFRNRSNSKMLNLYVPITGYNATHNTLNTFLKTDSSSIVGSVISWTNDTANNRYYNTVQNICIYPVNNVEQAYKENELAIAKYIVNGTSYYTTPVVQKEIVASDGTKELVDIEIESESVDNGNGTRTVLVYSNDDVQPNKICFDYMTDLLSVEKLKSDQITDADYMFRGCNKLTSICNGNFELPNVETAVGIFQGCYKLQ